MKGARRVFLVGGVNAIKGACGVIEDYVKVQRPVQAVQFIEDNIQDVITLMTSGDRAWQLVYDNDGAISYMEISTLEGTMRANLGDWIIKGFHSELYPCRDAVFQDSYVLYRDAIL